MSQHPPLRLPQLPTGAVPSPRRPGRGSGDSMRRASSGGGLNSSNLTSANPAPSTALVARTSSPRRGPGRGSSSAPLATAATMAAAATTSSSSNTNTLQRATQRGALVQTTDGNVKGGLSSWPAAPRQPQGKTATKPRFLHDLEEYLRRELSAQNCPPHGPDEKRLQAHREVFTALMQEFRSYQPLLSAIANEYELTLGGLRQELELLRPLEGELAMVRQEFTRKLEDANRRHEQHLKTKELFVAKLNSRVAELEEERAELQTKIERLSAELSAEHTRLEEEMAARRLMAAEMNQLVKYRKEQTGVDGEDACMAAKTERALERQLRETQRALDSANKELDAFRRNAASSASASSLKEAEARCNDLRDELKSARADLANLMSEHSLLTDLYKETKTQKDALKEKVEELQAQLDDHMQPVTTVVADNTGRGKAFNGLGSGPSVPPHLRFTGSIRNRQLAAGEIRVLFADIWRERLADQDRSKPFSLFFLDYLKQRFNDMASVAEWAYNLHFGLERLSQNDRQAAQNHALLAGTIDEDWCRVVSSKLQLLKNALHRKSLTNEDPGSLTRKDVVDCIQSIFPYKTASQLSDLRTVLLKDMPEEQMEYEVLFAVQAHDSVLMRELVCQFENERKALVDSKVAPTLAESGATVTPAQLDAALRPLLPQAAADRMDAVLAWVYEEAITAKSRTKLTLPVERALARLAAANIHPQF